METLIKLQQYANQPIPHFLLVNLLGDYKSPNDKIYELTKAGYLEPIKKGLYILGSRLSATTPEPFLVANQVYGPSYVSMESAMSFYGMIPEQVFGVSSATIKPSKTFQNPMGTFSYTSVPMAYYSLGILSTEISPNQMVLIASREKALLDKIIISRGLQLRSIKNVLEYLIENLRMDVSDLKELDVKTISDWIPSCPKKETVKLLVKTLENL